MKEMTTDIHLPTKLMSGPILPSLKDYTAGTLQEELLRTIKYSRIGIILLEKESSVRARYEVFRRLNRFGSQLTDQEIRNATSRLFDSKFATQLRKLAAEVTIRNALGLGELAVRQMSVEEMILRLLAFKFSEKPLKHEIREYLDEFMVFAAEGNKGFKLSCPRHT